MNNTDNIKELFDDIKNIDFSNINSLFVDYYFITGDESLGEEINKCLNELYPIEKQMFLNRPKIIYEPLCPSDKVYWFKEGLDLPIKILEHNIEPIYEIEYEKCQDEFIITFPEESKSD